MPLLDHALTDVCERIRAAAADRTPLRISGGGSKDFYGAHAHTGVPLAGTVLDTSALRGITSYEADARELAMDLRAYADVLLEPGMAFSLEPDLDVAGIGVFRHCNTIIVTEEGCEVDSRLPWGAIVV